MHRRLLLTAMVLGVVMESNYFQDEVSNRVPEAQVVEIKEMKFIPAQIEVHPGDSIRWINKDMVTHNVSDDSQAWASSNLHTGESFTMEASGNGSYRCTLHPLMKGKISVVE